MNLPIVHSTKSFYFALQVGLHECGGSQIPPIEWFGREYIVLTFSHHDFFSL